MSDEKKNDVKVDTAEQTSGVEVKSNKKCIESEIERNTNCEPRDGQSDLIKPELNEAVTTEASAIFESSSAEGCAEQQVTDSLHRREPETTEDAVNDGLDVNTVVEKTLKETEQSAEVDDKGSEDSDDEDWSKYKNVFERCLTELMVKNDDITQKSFDQLCEMMVRPTVLYRERKRFYYAKRTPNEPFKDYMQRLTDLSKTCQFGKRQEETICDKFITSLMNNFKYSPKYEGCRVWREIQHEIDCKKALEMAEKEFGDGADDLDRMVLELTRRGSEKCNKVPAHLAEMIRNEIIEKDLTVEWDEIAGLDFAKQTIKESIVWPMLRPDIFTGLRKLPKAMLLFGPPGTGKTMIAKCIAAQSKSTFFYVSASTMASKYHGEAEQLVRALFTIAAEHQPSVIFFDEVDSLLTHRNQGDHEVSRRVKTEFMVQLDGANTTADNRILFIGATNRPQDLDEAVRRRFVKRLYIPLPDISARQQLLKVLLRNHHSNVTDDDVNEIATLTDEFSGADIKWLCQDAAMEPLRSIPGDEIKHIELKDIRPLEMNDFEKSLKRIRPSVATADLKAMIEWDRLYGSNSDGPCSNDNHFMYS